MKYSKIYKLVFTVILFCFGVASVAGYIFSETKIPDAPFRYYYSNAAGDVMFDHSRHTDVKNVNCSSCHHELYSGAIETECSECHEDEYSKDMVYRSSIAWEDGREIEEKDFSHDEITEIHENCTDCHSVSEDIKPNSCSSCHETGDQKPVIQLCSNCHEESLELSDYSHEDFIDIHERECSSCHQVRGKTGLYHLHCVKCHSDTKPEYFTESGETRCGACHLK